MGEKGRVLTGCRALLMLNGKKVGYATAVTISEEITYEPLKVIGNIQTEEHVPTDYDVTLTASLVRIVGETVKSAGWFPSLGVTPEEHLTNILTNGELVALVQDIKTKRPVATVEQVKLAAHTMTINARGVVGTDQTFVGIRVKDESEV